MTTFGEEPYIDDLIEFRHDEALFEIMQGETVVPRTIGDFLRDFEDGHLNAINIFLSHQADVISKKKAQLGRPLIIDEHGNFYF